MNAATTLVHNPKNDTRFDDLLADCKQIATTEGNGRDAAIQWALKLVDAAYNGVIDLVPDKHGKGEDDALKLTSEYALYRRGATQFDTKGDSEKTQIACARLYIKLGGLTKYGPGEPVNNVNSLMNTRRMMRRDPALSNQLDSAVRTLQRYARLQIKKDQNRLIDDPRELRALCLKPPKKSKSIEDKLKAIYKDVDGLIKGTKDDLQFDCNEMREARDALQGAIREFVRKPEPADEEDETPGDDIKAAHAADGAPLAAYEESARGEVNQQSGSAAMVASLYAKGEESEEHVDTATKRAVAEHFLGDDDLPPIITMDDINAMREKENHHEEVDDDSLPREPGEKESLFPEDDEDQDDGDTEQDPAR